MSDAQSMQARDRSTKWQAMWVERGLMQPGPADKRTVQRITRLELGPGRISADVVDKQTGPCTLLVDLPVWSDEQWSDVIDLLSRQALYAAQMLAGDFPDALEPTLHQEGLSLLPAPQERVTVSCTCDEFVSPQTPCPHLDSTLRSAGDLLAEDPWLLFHLRGRVREQVLRALRRKRKQNGEGSGGATRSASAQDANPPNGLRPENEPHLDANPLADDIAGYWGSARTLEQFRPHIVPPLAELVLLRRLGPPAFSHANAEVFDTLTDVYRRVTEAALSLAYAEDPPFDAGDNAPEDASEDAAADDDAANGAHGLVSPWDGK